MLKKVQIEKAFVNFHHEDYDIIGSTVLVKEMDKHFLDELVNLVNITKGLLPEVKGWVWEDVQETFKEEYNINLLKGDCIAIKIDNQWYQVEHHDFVWFTGFKETDSRIFREISETERRRLHNNSEEIGPFGGAFEDWEDYYSWKER